MMPQTMTRLKTSRTSRPTLRWGFSLLEVLLVIALVATVLGLLTGLAINADAVVRDGDTLTRQAHTARMALDRLADDLRAAVYCGPTGRYGVGLVGTALDHPAGEAAGDSLTLVIAGLPRGHDDPARDESQQRGRCDLRLVTWEIQTGPNGQTRLVRIEQNVLDAIDRGEMTAEVICDNVRQFHLQFWGRAPDGGINPVETLADGRQVAIVPDHPLTWRDEWRSGYTPDNNGQIALPDPSQTVGQTQAEVASQLPPEWPLPVAVHVVLVLGAPRPDNPDNVPDIPPEDDDPNDPRRAFETVIALDGPTDPVDPAMVMQSLQSSGLLQQLISGMASSSSSPSSPTVSP